MASVLFRPTQTCRRGGRVASPTSTCLTCPTHKGNVLFAVEFVGDGRTHATLSCRNFQKLLAILGCVSEQSAIIDNLEHEIRRGCQAHRLQTRRRLDCATVPFE